jgi:hypothetical protein
VYKFFLGKEGQQEKKRKEKKNTGIEDVPLALGLTFCRRAP